MRQKKSLNPVSAKQKARRKIYAKEKLEYLTKNIWCEVCEENIATQIHHRYTVGTGGDLCDPNNFVAVCRECHEDIHKLPREAINKNLIKEITK